MMHKLFSSWGPNITQGHGFSILPSHTFQSKLMLHIFVIYKSNS